MSPHYRNYCKSIHTIWSQCNCISLYMCAHITSMVYKPLWSQYCWIFYVANAISKYRKVLHLLRGELIAGHVEYASEWHRNKFNSFKACVVRECVYICRRIDLQQIGTRSETLIRATQRYLVWWWWLYSWTGIIIIGDFLWTTYSFLMKRVCQPHFIDSCECLDFAWKWRKARFITDLWYVSK